MDPKRGAIRKPDTPRNGPDTSSGSLVTYHRRQMFSKCYCYTSSFHTWIGETKSAAAVSWSWNLV